MSDPRNRCHESKKSVQCHEAFPLASFGSFVAFVLHLGVWFGLSLFVYIWYEVRVHFTLACMSLTSSGCLAMLFHWRLSWILVLCCLWLCFWQVVGLVQREHWLRPVAQSWLGFASKQRNGPRPPTPLDDSQPKTISMHTRTEIRQHLAAGSAPSLLHDRGKAGCGFCPCSPCGCHMAPFCLAPPEPVAEGKGSGLLRRAESHRQLTVQVRWPRLDEPESPPAASKWCFCFLFLLKDLGVSLPWDSRQSVPWTCWRSSPHLAAHLGQSMLGYLFRSLIYW